MTTTKEALDLYLSSGESMIAVAKKTGVHVDDLHRAVEANGNKILSRARRAIEKAIDPDMTAEITSYSAPTPDVVRVELRAKSSLLDLPVNAEIDTNQPIGAQLQDVIAELRAAMDAPHHVSRVADDGLPIGVYQIMYYYYADGWQRRAASDTTGVGFVESLMRSPRLAANEVAVASCQSAPGGVVIAGCAASLRLWDATH